MSDAVANEVLNNEDELLFWQGYLFKYMRTYEGRRRRELNYSFADIIDKIEEKGVDDDGNPISSEKGLRFLKEKHPEILEKVLAIYSKRQKLKDARYRYLQAVSSLTSEQRALFKALQPHLGGNISLPINFEEVSDELSSFEALKVLTGFDMDSVNSLREEVNEKALELKQAKEEYETFKQTNAALLETGE